MEQTWEINVEIYANQENFPGTGDSTKLYIDMSATQDDNPESGSFYYWNGIGYSSFAVGPHPHPRPHA